jgi:hypothetical protein
MGTKNPMGPVALFGLPVKANEVTWLTNAVKDIEKASIDWSLHDRDFAQAYNLQEHKGAVVFTQRGTNGACTLPFAINVTSVTRTGAGVYAVAFTSELQDANYLLQWNAEYAPTKGVNVAISSKATTGFTMTFTNLSDVAADPAADVHVTVIGNG